MINSSTYIRTAWTTLFVMGLAAGPILFGANEGVQTMFNAPLQWVPRDAPARQSFNEFIAAFDVHEMVLVSWPGCTLEDERAQRVASALMASQKNLEQSGEPALIGHVLGGYSMLRQLQRRPADLSQMSARRRLQGILVGADGETSCLVVELTEQGAVNRRQVLDSIRKTAAQIVDCRPDELRLAGPPVDGLATDDASISSLQRFSLPAILISFALCWWCLKSLLLTIPILAIGALGQSAMLAAVYFGGVDMNAVLIVLPALVFVLTVSAGVHLANYFYDEIGGGKIEGATTRALKKAWLPCCLAAVTTAIGLGSLIVSDVAPVRMFGVLAASGILVTVLLLFLVLPGAMELYLRRQPGLRHANIDRVVSNRRAGLADRAAQLMSTHASWMSATCLALLFLAAFGLLGLRSSINVVSLLAPENRAVEDFQWFEHEIGPLIPLEMMVHFDEACALSSIQRLQLVTECQRRLSHDDNVGGILSAATFFPAIPRQKNFREAIRRSVMGQQLDKYRADLINAKFLREDASGESWRISARVKGLEDLDYKKFYKRLNREIKPLVQSAEQEGTGGIRTTFTGVSSVVFEIEGLLLQDLFQSFLVALILVSIVMSLALRSIPAAFVAMVPNVFPTIILFGGMGWMQRPVDIGTIMTASVALGIAVDGTFHFLKWYRHDLSLGRRPSQAIRYSYHHCGRALCQTTTICALGLIVFAFSDFLPARHFSITMLILLVAALVGDLVVLPALLLSPVMQFLKPFKTASVDQSDPKSRLSISSTSESDDDEIDRSAFKNSI